MKKNFLFTFTLCLLFSCNKKFNDVGSEIFDQSFYQSKKVKYPVKISHDIVDFVQTNNAPVLNVPLLLTIAFIKNYRKKRFFIYIIISLLILYVLNLILCPIEWRQ